jgi:ABC-2 type transport system permease protein
MAVAIPMLLLVLFGYALTLDVDRVPLVVWDQSQTQASRDFVSRFSASRYFVVEDYVRNYREVERAVDSSRSLAALVVPGHFASRVASGQVAPVQVIVDGSDSNTATIALGYANAVAQAYSQDIALSVMRRAGASQLAVPLDVRPRVWFNAEMESRNYIIPGLIAVIMMVIAALLTSLTVAREWERGTMEQLISTPVRGPELILGKLLPYFAIGLVDVLLAVLMAEFLFEVPMRGSPALVFAFAAVFLTGALSLGMLISIVTKSQLLASQLAMVLTFLPSFLLSDFMYAVSNMPAPIQAVTYAIPARYFVGALKGIYLKGIGLEVMAFEAGLLTVFAVVVMTVATATFKKALV